MSRFKNNLSEEIKLDHQGLEKISDIFLQKLNINKNLIPVLSTHYFRHYFISSNGCIRATYDRNLKSFQMQGWQDLNFKKNFNNSVFEIKYNKDYDSFVKKNLKDISLRITKSSKYVISALDKPVSFS